MATNKRNVIVGAARLFIGDQGSTVPAAVAGTSYATTIGAATGFNDVGFTQEGIEISYEPDYGDVEVDQYLDSARTFKTGQRVTINTTFAEATLENLLIVWAQADSTLATTGTGVTKVDELTISGGNLGEAPLERILVAVGNGPEQVAAATTPATPGGVYAERTYTANRVLSVDSSAHAMRRAEATVFPVSFRLLPGDAAGAPYGTIRDRVRTW